VTPAEELRKAAARLREVASTATPGPWQDCSDPDGGAWPRYVVGTPRPGEDAQATDVLTVHESVGDHVISREDTAWIALANPALAEPLLKLLEGAAEDLAGTERLVSKLPGGADPLTYCDEPGGIRIALDIARAILREVA